jgi:hypothetical protein
MPRGETGHPAGRLAESPQGCPGNENGLLCPDRNELKVVMRGLDPRIHAVAGVASACYEDVDGRIKSGHDDSELHKGHCAFGSSPMANSRTALRKPRMPMQL